MQNNSQDSNLIRSMVRGVYALQQLRIQSGNRITANFRAKLGITPDGMSEKDLEKAEKSVLDKLRASHRRITDAIVKDGQTAVEGKLPTLKKFKGDELISTYTELVLVDSYVSLLRDEERNFDRLEKVLTGIPIYDEFLSQVRGIGPAMAGIIISEIDIHKAEYPSSLWAYAGLDCVTIGKYVDELEKEHIVPAWQIDAFYENNDPSKTMMAHDRYPVNFEIVGRSKKEACLTQRSYTNKDGKEAMRNSITYNPFLKTKLIGVLGTSFLRSGTATVDGVKMGATRRQEMAEKLGFEIDVLGGATDEQVITFLKGRGYNVVVEPSEYAKVYYEYKNRIENMPAHKEKSDGHRHNMAIRYAVKRFLVTYYQHARRLAGLPVALEYAISKLGLTHKVATLAKERKAA